jgi:(S)-ureidoglycine aminohydrolase
MGWEGASAVMHITPELGARFTQYTATLEPGSKSSGPGRGIERFVFVLEGELLLAVDTEHQLRPGQFAFLPAGMVHQLRVEKSAAEPTRLTVFEKLYRPMAGAVLPQLIIGDARDVPGEPFQGDPDAKLQTLLPVRPELDMAVNLFTYQPGAALPQVEVHVMEHGLVMLDGAGVYRLNDCWYPVQAGDVIWMASFCPQWFVAMGKSPARYLYYKDVHRDQLGMP